MRGLKTLLLIIACLYMMFVVYQEGLTPLNGCILGLIYFAMAMNIWQASRVRKKWKAREAEEEKRRERREALKARRQANREKKEKK